MWCGAQFVVGLRLDEIALLCYDGRIPEGLAVGSVMTSSEQTPIRALRRVRLRDWLRDTLARCFALTFLLVGCARLQLPGEPPEPMPLAGLTGTPTIAPVLLTPMPTRTSLAAPAAPDLLVTPTFALPLPDPTCEATPMWGLGDVWSNEAVRTRLGCLVGDQVGVQGEELYFERGHMLSRPGAGLIYVLFGQPEAGTWGAFADTFLPPDLSSDPAIVPPTPESGVPVLMQPQGSLGKLWRENAWLREALGWALVPYGENGEALAVTRFEGVVQDFERGTLLWNGNVCFVLRTSDMSWTMY